MAEQMATLDYAPTFQMGHPSAFELANRLVQLTPGNLDHVFFTNSGSESVDTALKIAIRNLGLVAGIELRSRPGAVGARGYEALVKCFEKGILIRTTGDTIALSPPLIVSPAQIDELVTRLAEVLKTIA